MNPRHPRAMMAPGAAAAERGPFRTEHLRPGDRYELSDGHAIYCAPAGGDHAQAVRVGASALAFDPLAQVGVDAGYAVDNKNMRAPDLAIGNVPDRPGWIEGSPPIAVEYASVGQDEDELEVRIGDLLARGTQQVWVVRLRGPRHVVVHTPGAPPRIAAPGTLLTAPGVLQNPVPVEALFDPRAAADLALHNLLTSQGYAGGLDEVREAARDEGREEGREVGREEGREEGLRRSLRLLLGQRFPGAGDDPRIDAMRGDALTAAIGRLLSATSADEVLG